MLTTYFSLLSSQGPVRDPRDVDQASERYRRHRPPVPREVEGVARSAARAADEASADEASADEARRRLRERGIVPIEPDDRIGALLAPEEFVVAVRRSVFLERRMGPREHGGGLGGDLYVTTRRLVHLARLRVEYALDEIRDAVEADGALRLIVGEDRGVEIEVLDPRLLRVEIAAAREAARASAAREPPAPEVRDGSASPDQREPWP